MFSSSDDAAALPGSDDDADTVTIVNDHDASEEFDTLAEEENDLLSVRTKRNERHNDDSAANLLLTL